MFNLRQIHYAAGVVRYHLFIKNRLSPAINLIQDGFRRHVLVSFNSNPPDTDRLLIRQSLSLTPRCQTRRHQQNQNESFAVLHFTLLSFS